MRNKIKIYSKVILRVWNEGERWAEERIFQIVPSREVDRLSDKVSVESPFGMALMDRKEGEAVKVKLPRRTVKVEIMSIIYPEEETQ